MANTGDYKKNVNSPIGLTLIEVMLIIALLTLGVVLVAFQYQKNVSNRKITQIQNSVRLLSTALEQYYYANCYTILSNYRQSLIPPANLIPYIITPKVIGNAYAYGTKSGLNAYVYSQDATTDFPSLSISTTFNQNTVSKALLNTLAATLKPTTTNGYAFFWSISPGNTTLMPAPLSSALSYTNTLSAKLSSPDSMHYASTCFYWQQPVNRCKITGDNSRCDYQSKP